MNKDRLKKLSCTIIALMLLEGDQKPEYQNNKEALIWLKEYNKFARAVLEYLSESDARQFPVSLM